MSADQRESKEEKTEVTRERNTRVSNPSLTGGIKTILIILLVLIIIGVVGFLVYRNRSKNNNPAPNTADQIRQSFTPPATSTPSFTPPPSSSQSRGAPTTGPYSTLPNPPSSRPQTAPPRTTAPRPVKPRTPAPAYPTAPVIYRNNFLGFELSIPGSWTADDRQDPSRVVFFDRNTGQIAGYVETYSNISGENIITLARMLQGSPAVTGISQTTISGRPALAYSAANGYSSGIATINGSRIYYLHGNLISPQRLSGFRFTGAG